MNNFNKLYEDIYNNKILNSNIKPQIDEEFDFAMCHGSYLS